MKTLKSLLLFSLFLCLHGCGEIKNGEESAHSQVGKGILKSQDLLARAEFVPIKEVILFPPFSTEIVTILPEGKMIKKGEKIVELSPGDRIDSLLVDSAQMEIDSANLTLEETKLKIAGAIEEQKLKLAEIEAQSKYLEYEKALRSRDWQNILELEEGLKLDQIRLEMLQRQAQATSKMVARGFASRQQLLEDEKNESITKLSLDLSQRLIPFLEDKTDDKKIRSAFEAYEKSRLAYGVASMTLNKNLAEFKLNVNQKKRAYEDISVNVKKVEDEIASITINAPCDGLLLYGLSYTGSEMMKIRLGSQVYPGIRMVQIVDPDSFGVSFDLDPKDCIVASPGVEIFFRPDAYPEFLVPCEVSHVSPLAVEIQGGKPDGRNVVNVKAAIKREFSSLKLGYSGSVFRPEMVHYWQKSFTGNRNYRLEKKEFSRKMSTTGEVKPASFSYIVSLSSGKLNFLEEEGKTVKAGDIIAKIDTAEAKQKLDDYEIRLRKAKEELQLMLEKNQVEEVQLKRRIEVKKGALEVARLKHEALLKSRDENLIIDLKRSKELVEAKILLAREKIEHVESLLKKGLRSELDLIKAKAEVAALLKEKAIVEYKLELEESGPSQRTVELSRLEVEKAKTELELTEQEVSQASISNAMSTRIKELEIKRHELTFNETKKLIEMADIKAPFSGVLVHNETQRSSGGIGKAKVGDKIFARVPFMQVAEMSNLQVHTEVSEMDVKFLKPGDKVKVILKGSSVSSFPGWVSSVSYVADTQFKSRQDAVVKVVVDLLSPENGVEKVDSAFRPGQSCEVEFELYRHDQALVVPYDGILPTASGPCLVTIDKQLKPVELEFSDGLNGGVLKSGAAEGEEILLMEAIND